MADGQPPAFVSFFLLSISVIFRCGFPSFLNPGFPYHSYLSRKRSSEDFSIRGPL
jgi:hypothetical protein